MSKNYETITPADPAESFHRDLSINELGAVAMFQIPRSVFTDSPMGKEAASLDHFGVDSQSKTSNVKSDKSFTPLDAFTREGSSHNID